MTEAELFETVRGLLNIYRWLWVHHYNSQRSNPGFPDIVAVRDSRVLFLEIKGYEKTGKLGTLSPHQQDWLDKLRAAGQEAYVVIPDDNRDGRLVEMLQ